MSMTRGDAKTDILMLDYEVHKWDLTLYYLSIYGIGHVVFEINKIGKWFKGLPENWEVHEYDIFNSDDGHSF